MEKYHLNPNQCDYLRSKRQEHGLAAENLSSTILGKSKSWLSKVERGEISAVRQEDLVQLLAAIHESTPEKIIEDHILNDFLKISDRHLISDWLQSKQWDECINFTHENLYEKIQDELEKFSSNIFKNIEHVKNNPSNDDNETKRFEYILLRTLKSMNDNLDYNVIIFAILNTINFQVLKYTDKNTFSSEIGLIMEMHSRYKSYEQSEELKTIANTKRLDNIKLLKQHLALCNNILTQMIIEPIFNENIGNYNHHIEEMTRIAMENKIAVPKLTQITSKNEDDLSNDITERHTPELLKFARTINKEEKKEIDSMDEDLFFHFSGLSRLMDEDSQNKS